MTCFECGAPAEHWHHVIPQSRGGSKMIPLCGVCHGEVHDHDGLMTISALTRAAMARKKAAGEYTGGRVPYGYRIDGDQLMPDLYELATKAAARAFRAGGLSLRDIGAMLMGAGYVPRTATRWSPQTIKGMLS